jgi:hypothetical protein
VLRRPFVWEEGLSGIPESPHFPRTPPTRRQVPSLLPGSSGQVLVQVGVKQVSLPIPQATNHMLSPGARASAEVCRFTAAGHNPSTQCPFPDSSRQAGRGTACVAKAM